MSTRHDKIFASPVAGVPEGGLYEAVTRVYNFTAALIGLIFLSPLMAIVAFLIKVSSRGPILYRGQRVGKDERIFTIYKFRTLEHGAESQIGARLLTRGEPRVTPVGRVLRKRKLDEFPQLYNVLRGDMNLVGPRPIRPVFLEEAKRTIPGYVERFRIPPGITGLAQLRHSYYLSPRNKLRYERVYMRRRSVPYDLWIILLTFTRLLSRQVTALTLLILMVLFTLFLPETVSQQLSIPVFGRHVSLINLAIFGMGAFFALRYLRGEMIFLKTPVDRLVAAFLVASGAVSLLHDAGARSIVPLIQFACTGFGLYYFVVNSVNDRANEMTLYMKGIAVIAFVSGLAGVVGFLLVHGQVRSETLRAGLDAKLVNEFLVNRNVLVSYFILCLPLLLAATRHFTSPVKRSLGLVCFVTSVAFAARYFSKRGMLVLGGTLLLYGWRHRRETPTRVLAAGLVLVLAAHVIVTGKPPWDLEMPIARVQEQVMLQATVLREDRLALFLGAGKDAWRDIALPETVESKETLLPEGGLNNMYLTLLLEYGIIPLFLMIAVLVGILRTIRRGVDGMKEPALAEFLWAILSGLAGIVVNLFFFDAFRSISVQVPFWIFAGLATGIAIKFGQQRRKYYRLWHYQY
jgi:lipopolysaccharide/colanic/teichoic acid biosynthesis glycosyltransferase